MAAPWFQFSGAKLRLHIPTAWPSNSRSNTSGMGKNLVFILKTAYISETEWYGESYIMTTNTIMATHTGFWLVPLLTSSTSEII